MVDTELNREKFTLAEISKTPDLVKLKVRRYIRDVRWHNLAKADVLYKMALKIDLFNILGNDRKDKLFEAIRLRHDCVHRNGFDVDGKRLDRFTEDYIKEVAEAIHHLI